MTGTWRVKAPLQPRTWAQSPGYDLMRVEPAVKPRRGSFKIPPELPRSCLTTPQGFRDHLLPTWIPLQPLGPTGSPGILPLAIARDQEACQKRQRADQEIYLSPSLALICSTHP
jgi:hypothetical protein